MFKRTVFLIISAVIAFLLCLPLSGLNPNTHINQYYTETYSAEDGLPQSSVLSMVQTRDGYIWLGTYEGLARFDGIRFKVFNTSNTEEMAGNRVRSLLEDSDCTLWIGTSAGLLRYSNGKFKNHTTENGLSDDYITTILQDPKGRIWIGTPNGLSLFQNNVFTHFTKSSGLCCNYISAIVATDDGNVWVGTAGGGLHCYKDGEVQHLSLPGLRDKADIRALHKDNQGGIWIGTRSHGVFLFKNGTGKNVSQADGLSGSDIRAIYHDSQGTTWIGTNNNGLNAYRNGQFFHSSKGQPQLAQPIRVIMEDREGSIWVGTKKGLVQLRDGKFIYYNKQSGLPTNKVRSIYIDYKKNIWLGTVNGGLVRLHKNHMDTFGLQQGLKSLHIGTIAGTSDGSIWFGTYGGGLHRLKDDKIVNIFDTNKGLSNNIIRAIAVDNQDRVWMGTNGGGVDVFDRGSFKNYSTKNGLSDDFVFAISPDSNGNIWIGTFQGHLNKIKNGSLTTYGVKDGLPGRAIWSIHVDAEDPGTLWMGTDGGGLIQFKNNRFKQFTTKDGLYSDLAFQVLEDSDQNLWMNCNRGIYSVKKKDLNAAANGALKKIPCRYFGKNHGIKNTECSGPAQPAGICTDNDIIWFPTVSGAVVIDPNNVRINQTPPPVVIEKILADGRPFYLYCRSSDKKIILPAGTRRIEFIYTGLSFSDSSRQQFKYKLNGFDEWWMEASDRRRVSYTNIPPGDYTFRVIAANSDGIWNNKGSNISFILKPMFTQTFIFRFLVIILFAIFSYFFISLIKKHLKLIAFWKKKQRIGSYEIEDLIGVGGMGIVYRVHSLMDTGRTYAMKVMKEEHMVDEVRKKRFKNESALVDHIDHPHIVKVHERGECGDKLYIVMELLEGKTLAERFKANNYPSVSQCIHIMFQVADLLVHLHKEKIIHRDLKPDNIMIISRGGDSDYVKLLDFGIARSQSFSHLTESGQVVGTLPYMPPEILSNTSPTVAVDVYSFGVIAYEMLTKKRPFEGIKPIDTMKKIVNDSPLPPNSLNSGIPSHLNNLIMQMIEKDPLKRPDAQNVFDQLYPYVKTTDIIQLGQS